MLITEGVGHLGTNSGFSPTNKKASGLGWLKHALKRQKYPSKTPNKVAGLSEHVTILLVNYDYLLPTTFILQTISYFSHIVIIINAEGYWSKINFQELSRYLSTSYHVSHFVVFWIFINSLSLPFSCLLSFFFFF